MSNYTCPTCRKRHLTFEAAGVCCHADFVECPMSDLPEDAEFGGGKGRYSYGTVFSGRWELVLNGTPDDQPVRVYPLPSLMSKMVKAFADARYLDGAEEVRSSMRRLLGVAAN